MFVTRQEKRAVKRINSKIKSCDCKGDCFETCSNLVPFTKAEMETVKHLSPEGFKKIPFLNAYSPVSDNGKCAFLSQENKCTIYENRPFVCRAYGAFPDLPCAFGCKPSMNPETAKNLQNQYNETMIEKAER